MHLILIPGLWLDASSWDEVAPALRADGHHVQALTLPGMRREEDRAGVTLADQVAAVVAAIDEAGEPVVLVGHSLGSAIAHGAVDARPDRVRQAIYIGGFPAEPGARLLELPMVDGEVPMPDWAELGEEANIADFDAAGLAALYAHAIPAPAGVLEGPVELGDVRRWSVPVTMVCPEFTAADLRGWVAEGHLPEVAQIAAEAGVDYLDLPGGHWPQLTQPAALVEVLRQALRAREA